MGFFRISKARVAALFLTLTLGLPTGLAADEPARVGHVGPHDDASEPKTAGGASSALVVASWGGAYSQAQELAFIDALRAARGQAIELVAHGGDPDIINHRLAADPAPWDVVDLSFEALDAACRAGLLERLAPARLASTAEGVPAREDYLPGGLQECGAASVAWSAVLVHGQGQDAERRPENAADLLDLTRFPGKRGLPKTPRFTLEVALLADGVAPADVYRTLESGDGVQRALAALERIKPQIVWWQNAQEPLEMIADGSALLALAFNGRAFAAIVREKRPISFLWNAQIYDVNYWAVPANARRKDAARDFVAYATSPERLAAQTRWIPYGPMRKSALAMVGTHAEVDEDMSEFLPSANGRLEAALRFDGGWWRRHEEPIRQAFRAWIERPSPPVFDPEIAREE